MKKATTDNLIMALCGMTAGTTLVKEYIATGDVNDLAVLLLTLVVYYYVSLTTPPDKD